MEMLLTTLLRLHATVVAASRARDERGDVPGWVLVAVMTAGLVGVIGTVASNELSAVLRSALNSVR